MRSLTTSHRRLHAPSTPDRLLDAVAELVDGADLPDAHQVVGVIRRAPI